jgi:hypothetical protein
VIRVRQRGAGALGLGELYLFAGGVVGNNHRWADREHQTGGERELDGAL